MKGRTQGMKRIEVKDRRWEGNNGLSFVDRCDCLVPSFRDQHESQFTWSPQGQFVPENVSLGFLSFSLMFYRSR